MACYDSGRISRLHYQGPVFSLFFFNINRILHVTNFSLTCCKTQSVACSVLTRFREDRVLQRILLRSTTLSYSLAMYVKLLNKLSLVIFAVFLRMPSPIFFNVVKFMKSSTKKFLLEYIFFSISLSPFARLRSYYPHQFLLARKDQISRLSYNDRFRSPRHCEHPDELLPNNSIYGVVAVVVRYTFSRFKGSRRFAGCGRLRRDAWRPSPAATPPCSVSLFLPSRFPARVHPMPGTLRPLHLIMRTTQFTPDRHRKIRKFTGRIIFFRRIYEF
ncbi:hypothetical protein PUN28_007855 [Cardiocondyla obscurior]|uniref:Uncharacterized protein n=1 Tax=Cardiocondyla obscurior TaxID=286306 RepID=A0AAW2FWE2_9HYME